METSGLMPTEFDKTTDALLRCIADMGVTDAELEADMDFIVDFFHRISTRDIDRIPTQRTIEVMDCAFLGLIYHRHVPFKDYATDETIRPPREENNYAFTIAAVSTSLVRDRGISAERIAKTSMEGGMLGRSHMPRHLDESDEQMVELRKQFLAMCMLGMLIHRLMWATESEQD